MPEADDNVNKRELRKTFAIFILLFFFAVLVATAVIDRQNNAENDYKRKVNVPLSVGFWMITLAAVLFIILKLTDIIKLS